MCFISSFNSFHNDFNQTTLQAQTVWLPSDDQITMNIQQTKGIAISTSKSNLSFNLKKTYRNELYYAKKQK